MHVLINSYTTYEAMSTYFVHAFVDGAISSSLVLCVQLTIVSITKSQHAQHSAQCQIYWFLEYFNGNQNSSFCCLHLCYFCCRTSMPTGGVVQKQCRSHRQMMKAGLQFCRHLTHPIDHNLTLLGLIVEIKGVVLSTYLPILTFVQVLALFNT